ncbi:MAG TPA: NDP-sugar synthase [Acidimicrobiales bacterium]|nr:NDP-sugar synthase [Acidimicrobiales bacterium]
MRAVVLVGGEGTRLRPLTLTTPKQMLPIVEEPMIERVIGHLAEHGIDEAVLSLGYRPDAFINAYPDGTIAGVHLTYAVEPTPLDTAGAIRFAASFAGVDRTFLVANGDVLTDTDLSELVDFHRRRGAEATISLTPVDDPSAFGVVPTDDEGRVEAFIEKPPRDEAPTNLINAGTYVFEPSVLDRIPSERRASIERETFPALVEEGTLFAQGSDAYWLDTGTPDAYLRAHRDLLLGRRPGPPSPNAEPDPSIGPGVWRIGTVDVRSTAVVRSLFGHGASVADNAVVEESVIGAGAAIEEGATVIGSVLLPGARVASRATVEGSVIGPGAIVGQRCVIHGLSVIGGGAVTASGTVLDGQRVAAGV